MLSGALLSGALQDLLPKLQHESDYTAHDLDAPELHTHRISSVPTQHSEIWRCTSQRTALTAMRRHERQCDSYLCVCTVCVLQKVENSC